MELMAMAGKDAEVLDAWAWSPGRSLSRGEPTRTGPLARSGATKGSKEAPAVKIEGYRLVFTMYRKKYGNLMCKTNI